MERLAGDDRITGEAVSFAEQSITSRPPLPELRRRRDLLLLAGGAVAFLALAASPVAALAQPAPDAAPLKIGTIGAGREGGALGTLFAKARGAEGPGKQSWWSTEDRSAECLREGASLSSSSKSTCKTVAAPNNEYRIVDCGLPLSSHFRIVATIFAAASSLYCSSTMCTASPSDQGAP
jgi:hypothetical protein